MKTKLPMSKSREFKLRHSTLIMNDLSASNFKPDDLVYVREVSTDREAAIEKMVEALENIRKENENFVENAVMDWDAVQEYAFNALEAWSLSGGKLAEGRKANE